MAAPYIVTTQIRSTATFRNLAGALADTTAVCSVKAPDGTASSPSVTHDSTGVYSADITLNQAGAWRIEWQGSVTVIAADDTVVYARSSAVDA